MEYYIILFTIFLFLTLCNGSEEDEQNNFKNNNGEIHAFVWGYEKELDDFYNESDKGNDKKTNEGTLFDDFDKTADNNFNVANTIIASDSIIRPCPSYDLYCIRKYFARHSKCKPVDGSVPEPYYRAQSNYLFPGFNLSTVQTGLYYRGAQGIVEDFFLNNVTDQAVLTVRFRNYRYNTTLDIYRFYRVGKEPAITKSVSAALFPSITTTTIFRGIEYLDLERSESSSFIDTPPTAFIDPVAGVHPDPVVAPTFAAFLAGIVTVVREAHLTEASFAAATFIQHAICDFGLHIV